jgi:hypothetical protein
MTTYAVIVRCRKISPIMIAGRVILVTGTKLIRLTMIKMRKVNIDLNF